MCVFQFRHRPLSEELWASNPTPLESRRYPLGHHCKRSRASRPCARMPFRQIPLTPLFYQAVSLAAVSSVTADGRGCGMLALQENGSRQSVICTISGRDSCLWSHQETPSESNFIRSLASWLLSSNILGQPGRGMEMRECHPPAAPPTCCDWSRTERRHLEVGNAGA